MASEVPVDPAVIRKTQESLGKIITKPPLTDKLLRKPPFAFLHDIITEVNKKTPFLKGLYSSAELEAKGKWTKEEKLAFLAKVIDMLEFVIEERISAKPAKIAAGKESGDTNKFLQLLANAILSQKNSKEAIQKVRNGEKFTGKTKARDGDKKKDKDGERKKSDRERKEGEDQKRKEDREEKKITKPSEKRTEDEAPSQKVEGEALKEDQGARKSAEGAEMKVEDEVEASKDGGGSKPKTKTKTGKDKEHFEAKEEAIEPSPSMERPKHRPGTRRRAREPPSGDSGASAAVGGSREERGQAEGVQHSPASDEGSQVQLEKTRPQSPNKLEEQSAGSIKDAHQEEPPHSEQSKPVEQGGTTSPQFGPGGSGAPGQSVMGSELKRPTTARRPPPRVVHRHIEEPDVRVSSGHDKPAPTVILDKGNEDEDEDEQFVIQDSGVLPMQLPEESFAMVADVNVHQKPEGVLTKTLLATKKHLEDVPTGLPDNEKVATISEAQRKKERELVRKEVERLQGSIQSLCQAANPLGKIMDYVQEDLDSMRNELETWRSENSRHAEMLRREERVTEEELAPLRTQLVELDVKIKQQEDLIGATKASVLKKDERIQQLFVSMHLTT